MIAFRFCRPAVLAVLAVLVLAGCGRSPLTSFYMFSSPATAPPTGTAAPSVAGAGPRVAVTVTVPAYLDRPQFVMRQGDSVDVKIGDYHQWSEPMADGVTRVLCDTLSASLASRQGLAFPLRSALPAQWRISVDVARFDGAPGGEAVLDALWSLTPAGRDEEENAVASGRFVARAPVGGDMSALATAESDLLARFGKAIAAELAASIRESRPEERP